jgi:hypothetical protein
MRYPNLEDFPVDRALMQLEEEMKKLDVTPAIYGDKRLGLSVCVLVSNAVYMPHTVPAPVLSQGHAMIARGISVRGPFDSNDPAIGLVWAMRRAVRAAKQHQDSDVLAPFHKLWNWNGTKSSYCPALLEVWKMFCVPQSMGNQVDFVDGALPKGASDVFKAAWLPVVGDYAVMGKEMLLVKETVDCR